MHVDGDAFFASCEQVIHPELKGKPVATGSERGIISSASYEAKKFGVKRGVPPWEAKKMCPGLIFVQSDYEIYHLFSEKMFAIMRKFTPVVEEYSIDEAFADITGFRRAYHSSYEEIGERMKAAIEDELGMTVSLGVSLSKVLAKVGSKLRKPSGFVPISGRNIEHILKDVPVGNLWGIGSRTASYCHAHGISTALDLAQKDEYFIDRHFAKPHKELWMELRGQSVYPVIDAPKESQVSISKTRTFSAPSSDRAFLFSQLLKNLENACMKARHYTLVAGSLSIFLKTQKFDVCPREVRLLRATSFPSEIVSQMKTLFHSIFQPNVMYRATGVTLGKLQPEEAMQLSLFESPMKIEKTKRMYDVVDQLAEKAGYPIVHMGGSLLARKGVKHMRHEQESTLRSSLPLKKEK